MTKLKLITRAVAMALCLLALFGTASCGDYTPSLSLTESYEEPDYSSLELSKYVRLGEYKDITLTVSEDASSAASTLWNKILESSEVIEYPESALLYYTDQTTRLYMHYADEGKMSYSELIGLLGMSDEDIEKEAKELVKNDLVAAAIIEKEGIELTESEKEKFFDKYAQKYTELYGYSEDYVKSAISDEVYSSMLYDKMMEYLLINNNLVKQGD